MLSIFVEMWEAHDRLLDMQLNIREFAHTDIHDELLAWQTEDMHRQYPNIDSDQEYVSWFTLIWPRSRTYDQTHHRRQRRRALRTVSSLPVIARGSKRAILRPVLFDRLVFRMVDLIGQKLSWSNTGGGSGQPLRSGGAGAQAAAAKRQSMLGPAGGPSP